MKRCAIFLNSKKLSPTTTNFLSFGSIVTVETIFLNNLMRQNNLDYSLFRFDKEFTAATKNHVMQTPVLSTVVLTPSKVKISWLITYFINHCIKLNCYTWWIYFNKYRKNSSFTSFILFPEGSPFIIVHVLVQ